MYFLSMVVRNAYIRITVTEFCNSVLDELCKIVGITKTHATVYHPQGNAYAERIHQFFKNALSLSLIKIKEIGIYSFLL